MQTYNVQALAARMAATDLRGAVLEVATTLPQMYRELVDEVGPTDAHQAFDAALRLALRAA